MEHSAILLTCIKRKSVLKTTFGLLFEWPLKAGLHLSHLYPVNCWIAHVFTSGEENSVDPAPVVIKLFHAQLR